jgi:hypothetical protein
MARRHPKISGRELNRKWGIGAQHALYRRTGNFYMPLERFPGALCDDRGYVLFATRHQYKNCRFLKIGARVDVPEGIASIPGYVRIKNSK